GEPAVVAEAIEVEELAAADDRRRVAGPERAVPHFAQSRFRPRRDDPLLGRDIVLRRAEERGPVGTGGSSGACRSGGGGWHDRQLGITQHRGTRIDGPGTPKTGDDDGD